MPTDPEILAACLARKKRENLGTGFTTRRKGSPVATPPPRNPDAGAHLTPEAQAIITGIRARLAQRRPL